jgi:hypothetical protein
MSRPNPDYIISSNKSIPLNLDFINPARPASIPARHRILTLAFLFPSKTDDFLNRLVARMSRHGVCHVEIVFEDDMAFSIYAGSNVYFRPRSFSNPDYQLISIAVPNSEYESVYSYCQSMATHEIGFTDYGMYASYLQPRGCPFLNTRESVQAGRTFCSKIVAEALQFSGNCEVEHLIPCTTTPSCLFAAFQDSQRKLLNSVPYKREQFRQGCVALL